MSLPAGLLLAALLLAGRLIASGLACGLNLYATIALIGLTSRFGWIELPPALIGLEQWVLILGATGLYAAEFIASTIPLVDSAWEAVHTVIRPIAAGALAVMVLEALPLTVRLAGGVLAATAALAAHSAKIGLRLVATRRRSRRLVISVVEDVAAVLLAVSALILPWLSLVAVVVFALILARVGPALWRATAFASRAVRAALRGFFGTRRWRTTDELPSAIRSLIPEPELGLPEPKATRAALDSPTAGPWRNGWLVIDGRSAVFFYRKAFRTHRISLPRPDDPAVRHRFLSDLIAWQEQDLSWQLHLLKDGPSAEITAGAIQLAIR